MRKSICFNASNLHNGGGIQVASSFLSELIELTQHIDGLDVTILISSEVALNLGSSLYALQKRFHVVQQDVYGLQALFPEIRKQYRNFDLVFSIFGPDYLPMSKAKRVVGFAQPWILYNKNDVYVSLGLFSRLRTRMKFWLQKQFFKGADAYIVELGHVKEEMLRKKIGRNSNIYVAYNTVSKGYIDIDSSRLEAIAAVQPFKLGIISRNYPHKNLSIIPKVKNILEKTYKREVEFYVTFKPEEFEGESLAFQKQVVNLGSKNVEECIDTYLAFDAVFFPSLLECFSATPLEAMSTGRALFASDMPFNRDVCSEHAYYFKPLDPEDAARVINDYIESKWGRDLENRLAAREHAINFSNARDRALNYINVIKKVLS